MPDGATDVQEPRSSLLAQAGGVFVMFLPAAVLMMAAYRTGGAPQPLLTGGVATAAFLGIGLLHQVGAARAAGHKSASPLYLLAVLVLWMSARNYQDWFLHAAMGSLVGLPLTLFVFQEWLFTGGSSQRRARALVRRLAAKTDWPDDLTACKGLPEVKALREALRDDAEPVLVLLMHPKPEVRIAALAALEFRPGWRKGQAEIVLKAAKFATEPPVRAAAMMALANVDDPHLAGAIAVYLRDVTPLVRMAAAEALLWDVERRWVHVRRPLRTAMADARCLGDGPLPINGRLPNQAMQDLTIWSGEAGPIGVRSTMTLLAHYRQELNENPGSELIEELTHRIKDSKIPSSLRLELAHLLAADDFVDSKLWRTLLQADQPSALRLLAAGALLREGTDEPALATLQEVARVPNREMALQVAAIVQRCLRVDMGLPIGGELPEPQSKLAAAVARRVVDWADGKSKPLPDDRNSRRSRISSQSRLLPRPSGENPRRRA